MELIMIKGIRVCIVSTRLLYRQIMQLKLVPIYLNLYFIRPNQKINSSHVSIIVTMAQDFTDCHITPPWVDNHIIACSNIEIEI